MLDETCYLLHYTKNDYTKLLCRSPTKCFMHRNGKVDSRTSTLASHKSPSFISFLVFGCWMAILLGLLDPEVECIMML